jgi:hypothetical protein
VWRSDAYCRAGHNVSEPDIDIELIALFDVDDDHRIDLVLAPSTRDDRFWKLRSFITAGRHRNAGRDANPDSGSSLQT